jgi:hypothetical protein
MKIHPTFERLQQFATADYPPSADSAHLEDCSDCRHTVQWFRATRSAAAALSERPAPAGSWERTAARVRAGESVLLPTELVTERRSVGSRALWRAALGLLLLAGAAAAAIQGPALWRWAEQLFSREKPSPVTPAPVAPQPAREAVLLVEPHEGRVVLVLEQPRAGVRIHVRLSDVDAVEVRGRGAAADAQFRSGAGRLTIVQAAGGELDVTIPQALAVMRIEVDGAAYLTKQGRQIRIFAPAADTVGSEFIFPIVR